MGDADHGHALFGQLPHRLEHLPHQFGVEGGGHLVEQHDIGVHCQRAGDGDALLLPPRQARGVFLRLFGEAYASLAGSWIFRRLRPWNAPEPLPDPSITFCNTVMWGKRLKCWKTMPMRVRSLHRSASLVPHQCHDGRCRPSRHSGRRGPDRGGLHEVDAP